MPIAQYFSGKSKVMKSAKQATGDNKSAKAVGYGMKTKQEGENSPENKTAPKKKTLAQRIAGEFQSL